MVTPVRKRHTGHDCHRVRSHTMAKSILAKYQVGAGLSHRQLESYLMYANSVLIIHLVKLINKANSLVS